MEIKDLIRICKIEDAKNGTLKIWNMENGKKYLEEIKAKKSEILAYLAEKEAQEEARRQAKKAKIAAIEGLEEINNAINAETEYNRAFNKMMEDESNDGVFPPKKPAINSADLKQKYPRAAAYIKAENWSFADHYVKSAAGKKAKERIVNGEDYKTVITEMEKEFSDHCMEHIWD